jgi:hypothetical protein
MDVIVSAYRERPFIDGRYYEQICFICCCVPQSYHFDEKTSELVEYPWRPDKLYTWLQMCNESGFNKKDAEEKKAINKCIRSVKAAVKSMNADTRAEMIKYSKANERRTFVDETEVELEAKRADPKEARKKIPAKRATKKAAPKRRKAKITPHEGPIPQFLSE